LAVRLLGDRLPAVAVLHDAVGDDDHHDHTDDAGDEEHRPLEVVDLLGVVTRRVPAVLRGVLCARREAERGESGDRERAEATTAGSVGSDHGRFCPYFQGHASRLGHGTTTSSRASEPATVKANGSSTAKLGRWKITVRNCEPPDSTSAVQTRSGPAATPSSST